MALSMLQHEIIDADGLSLLAGIWCRRDNLEQDWVIVNDIYLRDAYRVSLLGTDRPVTVIDVGAHIGTFAKLWHERHPRSRIICVEACPENIPALRAIVGSFAEVVHAACTYDDGELGLLNAVRPNCESTGGSIVVPLEQLEVDSGQPGYKYWHDRRPLPKVTLEGLMDRFGLERIDILKTDCEGSEYSILGKTPSLGKLRFALGEFHGCARWDEFRATKLPGWDYGEMSRDSLGRGGIFHLRNPAWDGRDE
jgi:FkbM family methyltransferase